MADLWIAIRRDGRMGTVIEEADLPLIAGGALYFHQTASTARGAATDKGYVMWEGPGGHNAGAARTYLHRKILGLEMGDPRMGDHKDRDPLNNRRSNLRVVTAAENNLNSDRTKPPRNAAPKQSKYRSVYWDQKGNRWIVRVKNVSGGGYHDEDEAGRVATAMRRDLLPAPLGELVLRAY